MTEIVRYFELEINHRPLPQETPEDHARMVGKCLALFHEFGEAQEAN